MKVWKEWKRQGYPGGVKLTTKELRDYFATQVSAQVSDPNTVTELMRHTSLTTTSRYVRTATERMKEAVQNLGANFGGKFGGNSGGNSQRKNTQKRLLIKQVAKRLSVRNGVRKYGGGTATV
jgi:integrase-like protein